MQTTLSPLTFTSKLGDAFKAKDGVLALKDKHLQALKGTEDSHNDEFAHRIEGFVDLYAKADKFEKTADTTLETGKTEAKTKLKDGKGSIKNWHDSRSDQANKALEEARQLSAEVVQGIEELASDARKLAKEAKTNASTIKGESKHVTKALKSLAKADVEQAGEVADNVKEALSIIKSSKDVIADNVGKLEKLEAAERKLHKEQKEKAAEKGLEAILTSIGRKHSDMDQYYGQIAQIKEDRAQALTKLEEAYRGRINAARELAQEYKDLSGANHDKAVKFEQKLNQLDKAVKSIKRQAIYTRATNLPVLTSTAIGLRKMGEAATKNIVDRIVRVLTASNLFTGPKSKLAATESVNILLDKGSKNQKLAVATAIEINAVKIADKTENAEVSSQLKGIAEKIDELNLDA